MPANLTPEYEKAERRFREAGSDEEKLTALREMLSSIPKHKGTEKMQADIKRRISQLRKVQAKKGPSRTVDPFHVPRSGAAGQVVLIGPPNVGKSMLVAATTNAAVKVTDYPFATAVPAPGMWQYQDIQIELVDTPPVTEGHIPGGLVGTIRSSDIICIVVDVASDPLEQAEMVMGLFNERNINLSSLPRNELDSEDPSRHSGVIVAAKSDIAAVENISALRDFYDGKLEVWSISAATGEGLDGLLERLWQLLGIVRVYTKQPGKPADKDNPFTLDIGCTVENLAQEIHRELPEKMKYARIWGKGRYAGQHVKRNEPLRDGDIVEIHE